MAEDESLYSSEESKFCPKCGSSTLEQKEDVSTLKDEEKDKAEQSKGTFYFEKVKMIGRLRYKIIRTEVSNNEERLEISQKIGYSIWDILEVEKKQEIWSCIKFSMLSLAGTLIFVCPILVHFAE